jgi:Fe-S cluster biogenesis protein NfuA
VRRLGGSWSEPEKKFRAREKKFLVAMASPDDRVRRGLVAAAISECYLALVHMHCGEVCEKTSETRKGVVIIKNACEECRHVRRALKKHFIDTMTKTVNGIISTLFERRAGPFAGCPLVVPGNRYVDGECRVERITEATPPSS